MRGHADAETLAAFREELLSRRKAAQVSAHLAACPQCAALDAQLAQVTTLLAHAAVPPMPDAVTARIQAALAAEAAARGPAPATDLAAAGTATPGSGPDGARDAGRPGAAQGAGRPGAARGAGGQHGARGTGGRRTGWAGRGWSTPALRVAAVAAAVAVVAGGGYTVAQLLSGSPEMNGTASSAHAPAAGLARGPKRALPSVSAGVFGSGASSSARSAAQGGVLVVSTGTNYQPARLSTQASALLDLNREAGPVHAGPTLGTRTNGYLATFPHIQACAAHLAAPRRAILVDVAHYRGHPAAVILLPPIHGTQLRVAVVSPACTPTTPHVLATTTLPPPG